MTREPYQPIDSWTESTNRSSTVSSGVAWPTHLAGVPVPDKDVLELARLLREPDFDDVAEKLETAYDRQTIVLALTISDREAILRALDDPPDSLAELRGVLLVEHEGRVREGLV